MCILKRFIVCFCAVFSINALSGPGIWTSYGPDGGPVYDIVADPTTANVFYSATRAGAYKTTTGGNNWVKINNGITVNSINSLAHHQSSTNIVYAGGLASVFKTTDGGLNWINSSTGLPIDSLIINLSMAPLSSDTIYLSTQLDGIYKTTNAAATWSPANAGLTAIVNAVRVSPFDTNRVYAAISASGTSAQAGLFESTNGGLSWTDVSSGIEAPYNSGDGVTNIQFTGIAGGIYITTYSGVYKSIDNGLTWQFQTGPTGNNIAVNPSNNNEVIVSGSTGLWITTNGGSSWTQTLSGFQGNATEVATSSIVTYNPFDPTFILAGSAANGVYLKAGSFPAWVPVTDGMNAQTIRGLAIHPGASNRIYAAVGDIFSPSYFNFISTDSGVTWAESSMGLTGLNFRDIEVDPFTAATIATTSIYAVGRDTPTTTFAGTFSNADGGIYKSNDGGNTWSTIDIGIPLSPFSPKLSYFGTVRDITLDLNSSIAGGPVQTLFVAGSGRFQSDGVGGFTKIAARLYKSIDAGATWNVSDTGIDVPTTDRFPYPAAVKVVIDPSDSSIMYAATFLFGYDASATAPTIKNGVWKSTDAGATWTHASIGIPTVSGMGTSAFNVLSLVIDPITPNRLYASVHDLNTFESQIYKSEDSGTSWSLSNAGIATSDVRDIMVDSTGIVYAAAAGNSGNPGGVYQSTDFGVSWQSISVGLDSTVSALQLKIDESGVNPILYVGTTQSVHSFEILPDSDTDGVSNTTESSSPNSGDANFDGTADANQNNVSSLPMNAIDNNVYNNNIFKKGLSNFATIEVTPITGNCNKLEDVQSLSNDDVPNDAPRSFAYGILRFEIVDCQNAEITLTFHAATGFIDPAWSMRIFAPVQSGSTEFKWQNFPTTILNNQWTINLTDGQLGDIRPNNGRILFQGGVGFFNENVFVNGFE